MIFKILKTIGKGIDRFLDVVAVILLVFTTIVVLLAVYSRYISQSPIPWTEEIGRNGFIWLSFIGIALAERADLHFSITYFIRKAPHSIQLVTGILIEVLILYTMWILFQEGLSYVKQGMMQLSAILEWPESVVYIALPISVILTVYYRLKRIIPYYKQQLFKRQKRET